MPRSVPEWRGKTDDAMPPERVISRLLERQDHKCAGKCQRDFRQGIRKNCDHIVPLADEGENVESNLQMLCDWCHGEKTSAEATSRSKARGQRRKGLVRPAASHKRPRGFRKAEPQHSATRPITKRIRADVLDTETHEAQP